MARLALAEVPADVQCLEVVAQGWRSVTKRFLLIPGASVTLEMAGLPLGDVRFTANAFAAKCASSTDSPPTWISDVASATLVSGVVAGVTLIMRRNGRASIGIDFQDDDAGTDGAAGTGGPHPDGAAGSGGSNGSAGAGGGGPSDAGTDAPATPVPLLTYDEASFLAVNPIVSVEPFTTLTTFPPAQKTVVFQQVRYTSLASSAPYWVVRDGPDVGARLYRLFGNGLSGNVDVLIDFEDGAFVTAFGFRLVAFGVPNQFVLVIKDKDGSVTSVDLPPSVANTYVGIAEPNGVRSVTITQRSAGFVVFSNFAFGSGARSALYTTATDGSASTLDAAGND